MPFSPSAQVAKNTKLVLQCEECLRWRCVYSKQKISKVEKSQAMQLFEQFSNSCGASLQDVVEFSGDDETIVSKLYTSAKLTCNSPMEIPYYGVFLNEPLCFHCGAEEKLAFVNSKDEYPLCGKMFAKWPSNHPKPRCSKIPNEKK